MLAVREAGFHPVVMVVQVPATAPAGEGSAPGVDRSDMADELHQITSEVLGVAGIGVAGRCARKPRLHGPGERIARAGLTQQSGRAHGRTRVTWRSRMRASRARK